METSFKKTFKGLNFNLKNEIFAFFLPINVIKTILPVCKAFSLAIKNLNWFKFLKINFNYFISKSSYEFSEMQPILNYFKNKGESESYAYVVCLYLTLIKFKNHKTLEINNIEFWRNEKNAVYLKDFLIFNNSILQLDLSNNNLGRNEIYIQILKEVLEKNCSIQQLNLRGNLLGFYEESMLYLKEALKMNKSIQQLDLSLNLLGKYHNNIHNLKEAMKMNKSIKHIDLSENHLADNYNSFRYMKEVLHFNNSIEKIDLSKNNIRE